MINEPKRIRLDPTAIRSRRERLELTQEDAARRSALPLRTWGRVEAGQCSSNRRTWLRVFRALKIKKEERDRFTLPAIDTDQ